MTVLKMSDQDTKTIPSCLWRDDDGDCQVHAHYATVGDLCAHAHAMARRARSKRQRAEADRLTTLAGILTEAAGGDPSVMLRMLIDFRAVP